MNLTNPLDIQLFYIINKSLSNPTLDRIMPVVTEMASGETIFVLALILLFVRYPKSGKAALVLLAGLTVAYHLGSFLKDIVARPRPFMELSDINQLIPEKGFSFPSLHATMAFMAATALAGFFRRYALFFSLAIIVAFSRVYLGVHFVSDVVGGALLGTLISLILVRVSRSEP